MGFSVPSATIAVLEHIDDAVILAAPGEAAEVLHVNAAFERASGHDRRDAVGRSIESLLRPRPVAGEPHLYVMTRETGEEYVVRRKRVPVETGEGEPLVLETHRDVTLEREVRESEALYRKLAERASDIISRTDSRGRCIYISPSCRDVLGYEPEELVGRHALLDLAHPDDRSDQQQVLARFVQHGKTSGSPMRRRLRRKDGSYVWLETITHIERDEEGRIVEVQSWARDITSRVLAEQALAERKQMEERLARAERMALVGRLASGVGHEINNPLAYMLGSLELARAELAALSRGASADQRDESLVRFERHLVTIRDGAERVRDIVRDLKSLSTASDDRLGPVDVERTLDVAAATAAHEIRLRARLVKEYGDVPLAWANEGRLAQVFVNLLVNAAQAIPEGAAFDNEIRIVTREESGRVLVEICDTGTGIAPEDLPRVFEPFFTTKPKGTGLGLSISHNIVSALGGTLTAERLSPRGTLLRVTLPTSNEASAQGPPPASHPKTEQRSRILLVDDEPIMVRVLAELLSEHDVTIAYSGREAIARLTGNTSFDVVVCDLQMNDGTGVDVYEHLCERAPDLARRVIFTTGGAFTQGAREFLGRCPQPVLEKPFDTARFAALVSETAACSKEETPCESANTPPAVQSSSEEAAVSDAQSASGWPKSGTTSS
jgi:two-component system, cell cycle sensor histidine kinase and response regulator CckA